MGRFLEALRKGLQATAEGPRGDRFRVGEHNVVCSLCGNAHFIQGSAQLNTAGMTFLSLDWTNRSATTLACTECSKVEWFLKKPDRFDD